MRHKNLVTSHIDHNWCFKLIPFTNWFLKRQLREIDNQIIKHMSVWVIAIFTNTVFSVQVYFITVWHLIPSPYVRIISTQNIHLSQLSLCYPATILGWPNDLFCHDVFVLTRVNSDDVSDRFSDGAWFQILIFRGGVYLWSCLALIWGRLFLCLILSISPQRPQSSTFVNEAICLASIWNDKSIIKASAYWYSF